jgi:hypothetical protein
MYNVLQKIWERKDEFLYCTHIKTYGADLKTG